MWIRLNVCHKSRSVFRIPVCSVRPLVFLLAALQLCCAHAVAAGGEQAIVRIVLNQEERGIFSSSGWMTVIF